MKTNKEQEKKEYFKAYYKANKEKILLQKKEYQEQNKDKIKKYNKEYKQINKDKIKNNSDTETRKEYLKKYYQDNKEKMKEQRAEYLSNNRDKQRAYYKNRRDTDPVYKLTQNIRNRVKDTFRRNGHSKLSKTEIILGCTFEEFRLHLESKFEDWMTWDNMGNPKDGILELNKTWDIDHIIPLDSDKSIEGVIKLNHYTNLQPLCSYTNRIIKKSKPY
jgi:hypothetical protein